MIYSTILNEKYFTYFLKKSTIKVMNQCIQFHNTTFSIYVHNLSFSLQHCSVSMAHLFQTNSLNSFIIMFVKNCFTVLISIFRKAFKRCLARQSIKYMNTEQDSVFVWMKDTSKFGVMDLDKMNLAMCNKLQDSLYRFSVCPL